MAGVNASGGNESVGIINRVDGEVWIERGSERIPVIGSERLHPGDRLVSVGDGTAEVKFSTLDARGKPVMASVPVGGSVTVPTLDGLKGDKLAAEIEKSGLSLDDIPIEDMFNPLQAGASRMMAGMLGLDAGVAAAAAAAGFRSAAGGAPLDSTEVPVSDSNIPGLNLTQAQADALGEPVKESPALGAASLAALQSVTGAGMPSQDASSSPRTSESSAELLPGSGARMQNQANEPFRPDTAAASAMAAGTLAAQAAGFERVGDVAAAAPAMMGKEVTVEQIQSEFNAVLTDAVNVDDAEAAALLGDIADAQSLGNAPSLDALPGLLQGVTGAQGEASGAPGSSASLQPSGAAETDAFNRLLKMIEAFEAKINDLTGLVYSSFEGVGPDILNAKSEFSVLPTSELLSGLSDAVNVVTRDVSSFETGSSGSNLSDSVASTLVSGLSDPLSSGADALGSTVVGLADFAGSSVASLQQSFGDINSSLSNVLNTVSDLSGINPGSLSGGVSSLLNDLGSDLGGALNLVTSTTGGGSSSGSVIDSVGGVLDNLTGGGSSGSGSGGGLLDNLTGGGSSSGGSSGSGSGGGLLDNLTGGGSGGGLLGGGSLLDLVPGAGGLLNQSSSTTPDSSDPAVLPSSGAGSSSPDTSGGGSVAGGGDDLMSASGTSSGMSSSAGQSPVDPANQNNPV